MKIYATPELEEYAKNTIQTMLENNPNENISTEILKSYVREVSLSTLDSETIVDETIDEAIEAYRGHFDSIADFGEDVALSLFNIGDEILTYFNAEQYGEDLLDSSLDGGYFMDKDTGHCFLIQY